MCVVDHMLYVKGVTQLRDVVYIVVLGFLAIKMFNSKTHQELRSITTPDFRYPLDIVACQQTSQLYVSDSYKYIWRVSADGEDVRRWLSVSASDTFKPWKLSVRSARLLVTSYRTGQLTQFDAGGNELRRVQLPDDMRPQHAVESPAGTFIISQYRSQLKHSVSEVNTAGEVLRQFSGSLGLSPHIAVDSRGTVLVADQDNRRILLLDSRLSLRRIIIDERQLDYKEPYHICYAEPSGRLLVVLHTAQPVMNGFRQVAVFDMLCR